MFKQNIGIVFDEGPIARCYIETAKREKFNFDEIIYLGKKNFLPQNFYINYKYNYINIKPLKFLNILRVKRFINEVEDYFDLGDNFFMDAYAKKNLPDLSKGFYLANDNSINSNKITEILLNCKSKSFLNTGKQILKEIFITNKKFLHIHPAILPDVKGADGSLWNIIKKKCFGGSLFIMDKKIDEGELIFKKELKLKKFNFLDKNFSKQFYDIWFSFVDPAIRCFILKNSIKNNKIYDLSGEKLYGGEYFTFVDLELRKKILNNMLSSD